MPEYAAALGVTIYESPQLLTSQVLTFLCRESLKGEGREAGRPKTKTKKEENGALRLYWLMSTRFAERHQGSQEEQRRPSPVKCLPCQEHFHKHTQTHTMPFVSAQFVSMMFIVRTITEDHLTLLHTHKHTHKHYLLNDSSQETVQVQTCCQFPLCLFINLNLFS